MLGLFKVLKMLQDGNARHTEWPMKANQSYKVQCLYESKSKLQGSMFILHDYCMKTSQHQLSKIQITITGEPTFSTYSKKNDTSRKHLAPP